MSSNCRTSGVLSASGMSGKRICMARFYQQTPSQFSRGYWGVTFPLPKYFKINSLNQEPRSSLPRLAIVPYFRANSFRRSNVNTKEWSNQEELGANSLPWIRVVEIPVVPRNAGFSINAIAVGRDTKLGGILQGSLQVGRSSLN